MSTRWQWQRPDGSAIQLALTDRGDGNFHLDADPTELTRARANIFDGSWAVVRQVHGARVVEADPKSVEEADGLFTADLDITIAVQGADCAPIAFVTDEGPIGAVHAGWRGLAAGVIESMVTELRQRDAKIRHVVVGPVIEDRCYEFGQSDLDEVAAALGEEVKSRTVEGAPALDLSAGIVSACERVGLRSVQFLAGCTACSYDGYSHRARKDKARHALAMRLTPRLGAHAPGIPSTGGDDGS